MGSPAPEETMPVGTGTDVPILPYLLQLLVVTAVVGGLGYYSLRFVQNKVPGLKIPHGKQIHVIDRVALDPKRMMFVVNVGGRYWLLAATEDNVTTVAELSKDDLGGEFAQLLEQEKHRGETL
jgi:flagellar biosynthetic protein FliO